MNSQDLELTVNRSLKLISGSLLPESRPSGSPESCERRALFDYQKMGANKQIRHPLSCLFEPPTPRSLSGRSESTRNQGADTSRISALESEWEEPIVAGSLNTHMDCQDNQKTGSSIVIPRATEQRLARHNALCVRRLAGLASNKKRLASIVIAVTALLVIARVLVPGLYLSETEVHVHIVDALELLYRFKGIAFLAIGMLACGAGMICKARRTNRTIADEKYSENRLV